jgi:hypothetical protein
VKPRRLHWAGHVAKMGEKMNAYKIFVWKHLETTGTWKAGKKIGG